MADPGFDAARADALVREIGAMIAADENYAAYAWTGIALVIEVAERRRLYGFVYTAEGWEAETPGDFAVIERGLALAEIMAGAGQRWRRCLVQIARLGPELKVSFDYGEENAWKVTPANHVAMAESLRSG